MTSAYLDRPLRSLAECEGRQPAPLTELERELLALVREAVKGGNANTHALRKAIEKASPGWCKAARAAIAKAEGQGATKCTQS